MSATAATLTKLLAWRPGGYLRASGMLFGWLVLRTAAQTALFVLVARTLGAEGYGSLIAVMATVTLFAPLAGLGGQALLVRDGARHPENLTTHLGDALRLWVVSVVPLTVLAYLACTLLLPPALPAYAVAAIVLADLAGASLLELLARTWQAQQRMNVYGATMTGLIAARLVAFFSVMAIARPTPESWAVGYSAATVAYSLFAATSILCAYGRPRFSSTRLSTLATASLPFAVVASTMRIHAEANKPILARLDSVASAGLFGAAQRVTDLVLLPVQAMAATLAPRAYSRQTLDTRTLIQLGAPCLVIALSGGALIFMAAPLLPLILGPSYAPSIPTVRMLAFLPCLAVARMLLTTSITARNNQRQFYRTHIPGIATGIMATALLTMNFGIPGAVAGIYLTDILLISLQAIVVIKSH